MHGKPIEIWVSRSAESAVAAGEVYAGEARVPVSEELLVLLEEPERKALLQYQYRRLETCGYDVAAIVTALRAAMAVERDKALQERQEREALIAWVRDAPDSDLLRNVHTGVHSRTFEEVRSSVWRDGKSQVIPWDDARLQERRGLLEIEIARRAQDVQDAEQQRVRDAARRTEERKAEATAWREAALRWVADHADGDARAAAKAGVLAIEDAAVLLRDQLFAALDPYRCSAPDPTCECGRGDDASYEADYRPEEYDFAADGIAATSWPRYRALVQLAEQCRFELGTVQQVRWTAWCGCDLGVAYYVECTTTWHGRTFRRQAWF